MIDPGSAKVYVALFAGAMDIIAVFTIIFCQQVNTSDAGIGTKQQVWSLIKRGLYWMAAAAFLLMGIWTIRNAAELDFMFASSNLMLMVYTIFFPIMRAGRIISPDRLLSENGVREVLNKVTS